jgi:hypothetical protein
MIKETDPYVPLENRKQDFHFPSIEKLSYTNFLVAVKEITTNFEYSLTLADGANCGTNSYTNEWTSLKISYS